MHFFPSTLPFRISASASVTHSTLRDTGSKSNPLGKQDVSQLKAVTVLAATSQVSKANSTPHAHIGLQREHSFGSDVRLEKMLVEQGVSPSSPFSGMIDKHGIQSPGQRMRRCNSEETLSTTHEGARSLTTKDSIEEESISSDPVSTGSDIPKVKIAF